MHCSYSVLGAWCRSHSRPCGSFEAPQPHLNRVPLSASVRVASMPCLDAACTLFEHCLWRCPCAALRRLQAPMCYRYTVLRCLALPVHCLALPCACPCAALRVPVHCLARACALFVSYHRQPICRGAHASFPTACLCLVVPPRPRRGAPMAWSWPPIFPQDMLPP